MTEKGGGDIGRIGKQLRVIARMRKKYGRKRGERVRE